MSENSVLRFTVSFLLINSRSSIFTKSYQCKNRTTWNWTAVLVRDSSVVRRHYIFLLEPSRPTEESRTTAVRAPFFLYWPVDVDFASKKETCTYLKCNLLIAVLMMNNDIFFLLIFFVLVEN